MKDLHKLYTMKSIDEEEVVDSLCKYWEAELNQGMAYGKEYSDLHKEMKVAKKEFRDSLAKVSSQSITKSKKKDNKILFLNLFVKIQELVLK